MWHSSWDRAGPLPEVPSVIEDSDCWTWTNECGTPSEEGTGGTKNNLFEVCPDHFLITNTSNVSHKYSTLEIKRININEFKHPARQTENYWCQSYRHEICRLWKDCLSRSSSIVFLPQPWQVDPQPLAGIYTSWVSKNVDGQTQNTLWFLLPFLSSPQQTSLLIWKENVIRKSLCFN